LVGTLSICIVFFPVVLLSGVARFLFTPLALAVVYAMLTSYLLSRTLVTTMAATLIGDVPHEPGDGWWGHFERAFNHGFDRMRDRYRDALGGFIAVRGIALVCVAVLIVGSILLVPVVGQDFFPKVDAGMMRMHVRAPTGMRIEQTERVVNAIEQSIRKVVPPNEIESISDNIGLPLYYDLAFYQTDSIGSQDADVLIQLTRKHGPTAQYEDKIRNAMGVQYPDVTTYFQAADIVSQVLNFGLSASVDVQIAGMDLATNYAIGDRLRRKMRQIPGIVDLRIAEPQDYPAFKVDVDRDRALEMGISMSDVASSLLTSLSGNSLLQPSYWLDPKTGVNYTVISQTPLHEMGTVSALLNTPLSQHIVDDQSDAQLLRNIATLRRGVDPAVVDHYTVQRVINVNAAVAGRDLGGTAKDVQRAITSLGTLPPGTKINVLGQSQAMNQSFTTLEEGLILAIILVFLLMAANFQSWTEPLIILAAVPGALAGVLWMLVATHTTINVESLMGAIMAVGVGVANGNLLITFANELREEGYNAKAAAVEAGRIRLRPILMTALAMILGMLPMALSLGSGSEMNAPLGRAVIGGLLGATLMTLFVVPTIYSALTGEFITKAQRDERVRAARLPRV
jgi:multidrug efflux pump subunit AcrB